MACGNHYGGVLAGKGELETETLQTQLRITNSMALFGLLRNFQI
jgi:hypothetical protein